MDSGAVAGIGMVALVVVVVLPLALMHGLNRARQMENDWRRLADRHRLRYEVKRFKMPRISGELDGRELLIEREASNDAATTKMQITLRGPLPDGLHIGAQGPRLKVLGKVVVGDALNTGNAAFDDAVAIKANDREAILSYLTEPRRRAAKKIAEIGAELDEGVLVKKLGAKDMKLDTMDRLMLELSAAAAVLDVAPVAPSMRAHAHG